MVHHGSAIRVGSYGPDIFCGRWCFFRCLSHSVGTLDDEEGKASGVMAEMR